MKFHPFTMRDTSEDEVPVQFGEVDLLTYRKFQVRVETANIREPPVSVRRLSNRAVDAVEVELCDNGYLSSVGMLSVALRKDDSWGKEEVENVRKKIYSGKELCEEVWLVDGRHRLTAMKRMMESETRWRESLAVITVSLWVPPQGDFLSISEIISLGCQLNRSSSTVKAHSFQDQVHAAVSFATALRSSSETMGEKRMLTASNLADALEKSRILGHLEVRQRQRYAQVACRLSKSKEALDMFLSECERHPRVGMVHISHDILLSIESDAQFALGVRAVCAKVENKIEGSFQDMRQSFYLFFHEVLQFLRKICEYEGIVFEDLLKMELILSRSKDSSTVSALVERVMSRFSIVSKQDVANIKRMNGLRRHLGSIVRIDPPPSSTPREEQQGLRPHDPLVLSDKEGPVQSEKDVLVPSDKESPVLSEKDVLVPADKESPVPSEKDIPVPSDRGSPAPSEKEILVPSERESPAAPVADELSALRSRHLSTAVERRDVVARVRTPPQRAAKGRATKEQADMQLSPHSAPSPPPRPSSLPSKRRRRESGKVRAKRRKVTRRVDRIIETGSDGEYHDPDGSAGESGNSLFDDRVPTKLPAGTEDPSPVKGKVVEIPARLVVSLPSAWDNIASSPNVETRNALRAIFIPSEHRANVYVDELEQLRVNHALVYMRAAFNYYMRHPHELPESSFQESLKTDVWRQVGCRTAGMTAAAMTYFGRSREELLHKGFCVLEGFVADETVPPDGVSSLDLRTACFFRKLHSAVSNTFPGEKTLRRLKGTQKCGWSYILNESAEADKRAAMRTGAGRYTLTNPGMATLEQDPNTSWMARSRALLDVRIGQAMAALGAWDNRAGKLERMFTPKSGGRWLYTSKGCPRQLLHTDFATSDSLEEIFGSARTNPGFFTITTGPDEVPIWVSPYSHRVVGWSSEANVGQVSKEMKVIRVLIPQFSIFVGRGDVFHCGAGFDDFPGESGMLRYHMYFVPESVLLPDGLHLHPDFQPTFQEYDNDSSLGIDFGGEEEEEEENGEPLLPLPIVSREGEREDAEGELGEAKKEDEKGRKDGRGNVEEEEEKGDGDGENVKSKAEEEDGGRDAEGGDCKRRKAEKGDAEEANANEAEQTEQSLPQLKELGGEEGKMEAVSEREEAGIKGRNRQDKKGESAGAGHGAEVGHRPQWISLKPVSMEEREQFKAFVASDRNDDGDDVLKRDGIRLSSRDLKQLEGTNHLGDEVLNFMFSMINHRNKAHFSSFVPCLDESTVSMPTSLHERPRQRVHIMDTHFATRLRAKKGSRRYDYSGVRGALSRRGEKLTSFDLIVVPIFLDTHDHWTIAIVDVAGKRFLYIDSLRMGDIGKVISSVRRWLQDEIQDKGFSGIRVEDVRKWKSVINPGYTPRQQDRHACGIFCLYYVYFLELGLKPDFGQSDVETLRIRTGLYIEKGEIPSSESMD